MKTLPTTRDFQLPDDLHPILAQLLSYAQSNGALDLNPDKDRLLRQRYLHHSANWNVSDDGTYPLAILYVNRPTGDGKRVVLPNETNP